MSQTKAQLISDLVQALNFTGTASAPANGLFLSASNQLKLATASTERLKIDGTEVVVNDTGANVDFRVEGDTITHLLFADASTDRIGIGTSSPSTIFVVSNAGAEGLEISHSSGTVELNAYNRSGSARSPVDIVGQTFAVKTGNPSLNNGLYQDSSGKVHIGLTNGAGQFNVKNSNDASTNALEIYNDNGVRNAAFSQSSAGDATLDLRTNAASQTVLLRSNGTSHLNGGNVGIGTSSPGAALHINTGSSGLPKIRLEHTGAGNDVFEITSGIAGISNSGFGIYDVGETAYRIVIDTNGKVGIGQTNPGAFDQFVVQGTGTVISAQASSGAVGIGFFEANTGRFFLKSLNGGDGLAFIDGDNSSVRLSITADGDVTFGTQSGGGSPNSSTQIRHFDFGRDHWNSTAGDYRALRLKVYHVSNDDVYGIGISSNLLEIQSQQNIGFFAGSAGGGTGRRIERARIDATNGRLQLSSTTLRIDNAIVPESHAQLNIGSTGSSETRAIDIDGNWGNGEHKSITFTHGTSTSDIVGQINCVHNSPDSSLRFGKLYHGGNSTAYTMTLDSTSTSGANLTLHDGNLIFASGHGIDFSATSDASGAASELLDDYEEGTFTPVVSAGTTNTQTFDQTGRYTKIGRMVYVQFLLQYSGAGNNAHMQFGGLPFTSANNTSRGGGTVLWTNIPGLNDAEALSAIVEQNATTLLLYRGMDSSATTGSGGFTNKAMYIRVTYEAT